MATPAVRILIIDDHPAIRQGLALLLAHAQIEVCGEAEDTLGAQPLLQLQPPADLALVDLSFDQGNGFELITQLCAKHIRVIVYSMHEDVGNIHRSIEAGALGYVSKREDSSILLAAIHSVISGIPYCCPRAAQALDNEEDFSLGPRCSGREIQILQLLGQGLGTSEIAQTLSLSVRTIETYCTRIRAKLELLGMKELRQFAIRHYSNYDGIN